MPIPINNRSGSLSSRRSSGTRSSGRRSSSRRSSGISPIDSVSRMNPLHTRRVQRTRKRKSSQRNIRAPIGQPILNRTSLRLRTEHLPFLPPINTNTRIHEDRRFLPRHLGTRYRGRERTLDDYRLRTLRKQGIYPEAEYRNVTYPTTFTGRPRSIERHSRRISPTIANRIYRPVNNGRLHQNWMNYKQDHGFDD